MRGPSLRDLCKYSRLYEITMARPECVRPPVYTRLYSLTGDDPTQTKLIFSNLSEERIWSRACAPHFRRSHKSYLPLPRLRGGTRERKSDLLNRRSRRPKDLHWIGRLVLRIIVRCYKLIRDRHTMQRIQIKATGGLRPRSKKSRR